MDSPTPHEAGVLRLVSLQRIGSNSEATSFRLKNRSARSLEYVHWLGQGPEPVPYCKFQDGTISVCGENRPDEELFTHEMSLKPGKTVTFVAKNVNAVSVGVLLLLNGHGQYIWSEPAAQQRAAGDSQKPRT